MTAVSCSYWDDRFKRHAVKILPGEYFSTNGNEMIITILGSCVSACIQDDVTKIGGMNHFMLPMENTQLVSVISDTDAARYGNVAMERLINNIIKLGGNRNNLKAKIFGGGKITKTSADIGAGNISFVRDYLNIEGIDILSEDVGDVFPRKVYYIPETNDVFVKRIRRIDSLTIVERDSKYINSLEKTETESQVTFL